MSSTPTTTVLVSTDALFDTRVVSIKVKDGEIRMVGNVVMTNGTMEFGDGTGVHNPRVDFSIDIGMSDDGNATNSMFAKRVITASATVASSVNHIIAGSVQSPTTVSRTVAGKGHIHQDIVRLVFQGLLADAAYRVNAGHKITFEVTLGKITSLDKTPLPETLTANIISHRLARAVPALGDFVNFDSLADPGIYAGQSVNITYADLAGLGTNYTDSVFALRNLNILTATDASMCASVTVPKNVIVLGDVLIDCGQAAFVQSNSTAFPAGSNGLPCVLAALDTLGTRATDTLTDGQFAYCASDLALGATAYGYTAGALITAPFVIYNDGTAKLYDFSAASVKTNATFDATITLPSLTIEGMIYGDVIYTGQEYVSSIAKTLTVKGGLLVGRPKTNYSPVQFANFSCTEGGLVAGTDALRIGIAITTDGNFTPIDFPIADSAFTLRDSAVFANMTLASRQTNISNGTLDIVTHNTWNSTPATSSFTCTGLIATEYNVKIYKITGMTQAVSTTYEHYIESAWIARYSLNASNSETFSVLNSAITESLKITTTSTRPLTLVAVGADGFVTSFRTLALDDNSTIACRGSVTFVDVADERTAAGTPFTCQSANINITKLKMNLSYAFPFSSGAFVTSKASIGTLLVTGGDVEGSGLTIAANPIRVANLIDEIGRLDQLTLTKTTIANSDLTLCTLTPFTLAATESDVHLNFADSTSVVNLGDVTGSIIDVAGRYCNGTVVGASYDSKTKFFLAGGSKLDYVAKASIATGAPFFQDVLLAHPLPTSGVTTGTLNLPDTTHESLRKALSRTAMKNTTSQQIIMSISVESGTAVSTKLRPHMSNSSLKPAGVAQVAFGAYGV